MKHKVSTFVELLQRKSFIKEIVAVNVTD